MAITHIGNIGTAQNKSSSSTITITTTADAFAGDLIIVWSAWDNNNAATTEGPNSNRYAGSDSVGGNTWRCVAGGESSGANARSAGGLTMCVLTNNLPSGSTITITYATARTAKAATAERFTIDGTHVTIFPQKEIVLNNAADPGDITIARLDPLVSREIMLVHLLSAEGPDTDTYTWDSDYTQITGTGTTGDTADTNQQIRGGFRIATGLTTDTVSITSDTADRDYCQLLVCLVESSGDLVLPEVADSVGFQHLGLVGWSDATPPVDSASNPLSGTTWTAKLDAIPVGTLLLVQAACTANNAATTTVPNDEQMSIADSAGNSWTKEAGAQNGGSQNNNPEMQIFSCLVTNAIPEGGTITVTHTISGRSFRTMLVHAFAPTQKYKTQLARTGVCNDVTDPGSLSCGVLDVHTNAAPVLMIHGLSADRPHTDRYTFDPSYTYLSEHGFTTLGAFTPRGQSIWYYRIFPYADHTVDVSSDTTNATYAQLLIALATRSTFASVKLRGS